MADAKKVVIEIVGKSEDSSKPGSNMSEPAKTESGFSSFSNSSNIGVATAVFAVKEALQTAASLVADVAVYEFNKSFALNDDYVGDRNKNFALKICSQVTNTVTTTLSMASQGAMIGGPVGAAIGAAVGLMGSMASSAIQTAQAMDSQNIMLNKMDAQMSFTRQRAGWSVNAASIGEDL